jgi:RNA polymerase sigma factor (sigma-70 family)
MRGPGVSLGAIESVYRRRFAAFASVAAAILRDRDAGRDAVQEAFANAVRTRRRFRGDGSLEAWLLRAVVNAALSERRRRLQRPSHDGPPREHGTNGRSPMDEVPEALARLPERQRLVVFLRYYADLDYRTIADALGLSAGTVGATLSAAHASLRRHFEEVEA